VNTTVRVFARLLTNKSVTWHVPHYIVALRWLLYLLQSAIPNLELTRAPLLLLKLMIDCGRDVELEYRYPDFISGWVWVWVRCEQVRRVPWRQGGGVRPLQVVKARRVAWQWVLRRLQSPLARSPYPEVATLISSERWRLLIHEPYLKENISCCVMLGGSLCT
jgi:hypothetical protein